MPDHKNPDLDVSAAEERYLRKAFRRFALPYMAVLIAISWAIAWIMSGGSGSASGDLDALRQEVASVQESLAELDTRLGKLGAEVASSAKLARSLESEKGKGVSPAELKVVERELGRARARIAKLEKNSKDSSLQQRFDALLDRIARVERRLPGDAPAARRTPVAPQPPYPPPPAGTP